jgi:glycosyltransferase involved in cell wall biosynthesis
MIQTVISNGTYRFHLAPLAAEMHRMGCLSALLTGGYPKGIWRQLFRSSPVAGLRRLADRCEDIPDEKVFAFQQTEVLFKSAEILGRIGGVDIQEVWQTRGLHQYARMARKALMMLNFDIYHYRNCFGFESAAWAKENNRITICDHSIGHPYAVAWMRKHEVGHLPASIPPQSLSRLEQNYLDDFTYADHVLVNSNFVKETFIASGFPAEKVSVAWWGVDAKFLTHSDLAMKHDRDEAGNFKLLFSGGFGRRKGAHILMNALEQLADQPWRLTIAGSIEPDVAAQWLLFRQRFGQRINLLGFVSRQMLAREMTRHRVFVFPSLMEGSARVVFEAMASGCFIVTTPHAGSIVEDQQHGILTTPGDPDTLTKALKSVFLGEYDVRSIGVMNASLIRASYRQQQYADRVRQIYETVCNQY